MISDISEKSCNFAADFDRVSQGREKNHPFADIDLISKDMRKTRYIIFLLALFLCLPSWAAGDSREQIRRYEAAYPAATNAANRLRLANEFFAWLRQVDYIDEPIVFPVGAHMDSVDVNVYYYIAEWHYGEGDYSEAVDFCHRAAERCTDKVEANAKGDVYSLMGAAYFRLSEFDKAAEALDVCYEIDKDGGDFNQLSSTLNNIASVFVAAGKPQEAEKYILEAIAANSLTDNLRRRAVLFGTASEMYKAMNAPDKSLSYAQQALDIERQLGDSARIGVRLSQLANAQMGASHINEAKQSLLEAIPLLRKSNNLHSYGICLNQMGDILATEGKDTEAADYYRQAAGLFLKQGDMYNELHAREGLYKVTKATAPNEAMLHLERSKLLHDSIYRHETAEAISRYNVLYHNDRLQQAKEQAERRQRVILATSITLSLIVLALIGIAVYFLHCRHKQKEQEYEQDLSSLQSRFDEIKQQYRNIIMDTLPEASALTEDDKVFVEQLTQAMEEMMKKGTVDAESIAQHMHITPRTLQRRMTKTLSVTPQAYLTQVRMQKAKYLLLNYRDITIAEVAEQCGYTQLPNFTRAFTRYFGMKPSEMRLQRIDSQQFTPPHWRRAA